MTRPQTHRIASPERAEPDALDRALAADSATFAAYPDLGSFLAAGASLDENSLVWIELSSLSSDSFSEGSSTGPGLVQELRARAPRTTIVGLVGETNEALPVEIYRAGFDDLIDVAGRSPERIAARGIEHWRLRCESFTLAEEWAHRRDERLAGERRLLATYRLLNTRCAPPLTELDRSLATLREGLDLDSGSSSEELADYLGLVSKSHRQLGRLQGDLEILLSLSDQSLSSAVENHAVIELWQSMSSRFEARSWEAEVALVCRPSDLSIAADRQHVEWVLAALIENALKFTPEGETITLSAAQQGGTVQLSVVDTGRGIAPEDHARVFRRLEQSDIEDPTLEPGLGLGLGICRDLATSWGGSLTLESDGVKGTSVTVTVPLAPMASNATAPEATPPEVAEIAEAG